MTHDDNDHVLNELAAEGDRERDEQNRWRALADTPDTSRILLDIDRAQTRLRDHLHAQALAPDTTDPVLAAKVANAAEAVLDQWAYLRHCIEDENAPLPGPWTLAGQVNSPLGDLCEQAWQVIANSSSADGNQHAAEQWYQAMVAWRQRWFAILAGADPEPEAEAPERPKGWDAAWEQYRHLRAAADAVQAALNGGPEVDPAEFTATAEHLLACVTAVDVMCTTGDLPAPWGLPFWRRRVIESAAWQDGLMTEADQMGLDPRHPDVSKALADPRVTAGGGAAAKAAWDLAATPGTLLGWARVELMGHRIRVGVVSEVTLLGQPMLRVAFPQDDEGHGRLPEFYQPSALYGLTPLPGNPADRYAQDPDPYQDARMDAEQEWTEPDPF